MTYHGSFDTLDDYLASVGTRARAAADTLRTSPADLRAEAIREASRALREAAPAILSANARDVAKARENGTSGAMLDRLRLDTPRLVAIADSLATIADQDDPVGQVTEKWSRPNDLRFEKVTVPIGVIAMIYESRPNVTADAAALCLKSGNAVILRGGSEAVHSNRAIAEAMHAGLRAAGLPEAAVQLLATQDRAAVGHLLAGLDGNIDLIIPRGGKGLVARVQAEARVPVLAHLDGLNTTYVHESADPAMALDVIANAKMRRTGICGATETVLVDAAIARDIIPPLVERLTGLGCEIRGDARASALASMTAATKADFDTEHLAPILNLAVVRDLDAALAHIARHGSGHTDAILSEDHVATERFLAEVDSAIVMHNASTQFADGGEFGFGAEIGIATGRLHARGPVGAQHLITTKYRVRGDGTLRP